MIPHDPPLGLRWPFGCGRVEKSARLGSRQSCQPPLSLGSVPLAEYPTHGRAEKLGTVVRSVRRAQVLQS